MAEPKLILKDGTTFEEAECGYADRKLWCWMKNATFADVFAAFSDPEKTKEITEVDRTKMIVYYGFDELDVIRRSEYEPGKWSIDVRLTGENIQMEEKPYEEVTEDGEN